MTRTAEQSAATRTGTEWVRPSGDLDRERELAGICADLTERLVAAAGELRWYSHDGFEAALTHVHVAQQAAMENEPSQPQRRRRKPLPSRAVWDRDGWRCVKCDTHKDLTVDHVIPWSLGGSDELDNLQTLCGPCNRAKGARV